MDVDLCAVFAAWMVFREWEMLPTQSPTVHLRLKWSPWKEEEEEFVDYEEGLVYFYDADAAALMCCFAGCSVTEELYSVLCSLS